MTDKWWFMVFLNKNKALIKNDSGYALVAFVALLLFVGGVYTSVAFQIEQEDRWQKNYALGQIFADFSAAAHHYAQEVAYDTTHPRFAEFDPNNNPTGPVITVQNLIDDGFLPPGFNVPQLYDGVTFLAFGDELEGADLTSDDDNAITAYSVMDIAVSDDDDRTPTDITAFYSGAGSRGFYDLGGPDNPNIPASGTTCPSGTLAHIIWGDGDLNCLEAGEINSIADTPNFHLNIAYHDVMGAGWEAAYAKMDLDALFRYPQPEIPDFNIMRTSIDMDGAYDAFGNQTLATQQPRNISSVSFTEIEDDLSVNSVLTLNDGSDPDNLNDTVGILEVAGDTEFDLVPVGSDESLTVTGAASLEGGTNIVNGTNGIELCTGGATNCVVSIPGNETIDDVGVLRISNGTLDIDDNDGSTSDGNLVVTGDLHNDTGLGNVLDIDVADLVINNGLTVSGGLEVNQDFNAPVSSLVVTNPNTINVTSNSNIGDVDVGDNFTSGTWAHSGTFQTGTTSGGIPTNQSLSIQNSSDDATLSVLDETEANSCVGDGCPDTIVIP